LTTYTAFTPSQSGPPFSFQPTLDGAIYTVSAAWNLGAQRWYITVIDQFSNPVVTRPLRGSPAQVELSALSWANGIVTALSPSYLGYKIGSQVGFSIAGAVPSALCGTFPCIITGPNTFTYALPSNPGQISSFGSFSLDCNLVWGFFETSTLVYRPSTGMFEVNP
jgi:hypothetical protein